MRTRAVLAFVLGSILFIGCDTNKYFEQYQEIEGSNWLGRKQISFEVEAKDIQAPYNLFVLVRNTKNYKYQNLYLFMDIVSPSGKVERDTLECLLADVNGRWFGQTAGNFVDNKIWFKSDYRFNELGKYHFLFEQAMRENQLTEISDFGLRIERK